MAFSKRNSIYKDSFTTMILAAGLGERFRPHSLTLPKPAIPFLNIPFLYYSIHLAEEMGTEKIVINTHHLPEKIRQVANSTPDLSVDLAFTEEKPKILGSAGGIKHARHLLEGSGAFLTLNADSAYLIKDFKFWEKMRKTMFDQNVLAILALVDHPKVGSLYNAVWIDEQNQIRGISKTPPNNSKNLKGLHFTGMQLINDEVLAMIPEKPCDIFRDVLLPAMDEGQKVMAMEVPGLWYEGGNLQGYLEDTKSFLQILQKETKETIKKFNGNGYVESLLKRFWTDYHHRNNILDGALKLIHRSAKLDPSAQLEGFVVIGENAQISGQSLVLDSVIAGGSRVNHGEMIKSQLRI